MTAIPVISGEAVFDGGRRRDRGRAHASRVRAPRRGRVGDAGRRSTSTVRPAATSGRCPRAATGWRSSSGSPRSPATARAGCRSSAARSCVSDAGTGEELALIECASVTSLRTGGAAAVSAPGPGAARTRRPSGSSAAGSTAPGPRAAWRRRATGPASATTPAPRSPRPLGGRARLEHRRAARRPSPRTWSSPSPRAHEPVIRAADLRPGQHLAMLGADAAGKAEVELEAIRALPPLLRRVEAGERRRRAGARGRGRRRLAPGRDPARRRPRRARSAVRREDDEITLFDSTGLAIQDLAIVGAVYDAWRNDGIDAPVVELWKRAAPTATLLVDVGALDQERHADVGAPLVEVLTAQAGRRRRRSP